jgi:hypothetical protein
MKPFSARSDLPPTDAQTPAPASIVEQLRGIDTSVLEGLLAIRQEKISVEEYRARAEQMKTNVTEAVYQRVIEDYKKRCATLEQQAKPLKAQARAEYRKLGQLIGQTGRAYEQARFQKEEFEFRHAVGELDDAQLGERLRDPQRVLDECQADMTAIDEQKARFIEALGSEQAPEEGAAPEPPTSPQASPVGSEAAAPPPAAATAAAIVPDVEQTVLMKAAVARPAAAAPLATVSAPDVTILAPAESFDAGTAPVAPEATRLISPEEIAAFLLPRAALVTPEGTQPPAEYPLAPVNYIGRSEDNQIQIARPGVSRKHAMITGTASGYTIKDLGSQNCTFVNSARITERELTDGDTIEIAGMRLVFRSPWPARAAGSGAASKTGASRRTKT